MCNSGARRAGERPRAGEAASGGNTRSGAARHVAPLPPGTAEGRRTPAKVPGQLPAGGRGRGEAGREREAAAWPAHPAPAPHARPQAGGPGREEATGRERIEVGGGGCRLPPLPPPPSQPLAARAHTYLHGGGGHVGWRKWHSASPLGPRVARPRPAPARRHRRAGPGRASSGAAR